MKINWKTFPKLFVVLPVLHYALSLFMQSESEEHKRRKEQGKWIVDIYNKLLTEIQTNVWQKRMQRTWLLRA